LGNHDFDRGVDGLVEVLPAAGFELVNANFDIDVPALHERVRPYRLKTVGGRRIGIFGLGVRFRNLVSPKLHRGLRYRDPIAAAREAVRRLREDHGAEAIVALSHLGYISSTEEPGDVDLAEAVDGIDVVIGGHSHTFLDPPHVVEKRNGHRTIIAQVGFAGTHLGRVDLRFGGSGVARAVSIALPIGVPV